jgi:hypothetical protein
MTGSKGLTHWASETVYECSGIAGSPQGFPPAADYLGCEAERRTWSEREIRTGKLRSSGIITVSARRPGDSSGRSPPQMRPNDQSCWSHQCRKTTLTGEYRFHISTPLGIEPGSLMTGCKGLTHWTSETVYECSEIAGSPQAIQVGSRDKVIAVSRLKAYTAEDA